MGDEDYKKIKTFTDLKAWQTGHALVLAIYMVTKNFPKEERYSLVDQMRRAAVSIMSNLAEGFGRQGYKDKLRFYYQSQGSLIELKNQILVAKDVGYLDKDNLAILVEKANHAHALLQGLITKSKSFLKDSG